MTSSTTAKAYALAAAIGQELSILVVSKNARVLIAVYEPGGALVADDEEQFKVVNGAYQVRVALKLLETGDYIVHLWLDSLEPKTVPYKIKFIV